VKLFAHSNGHDFEFDIQPDGDRLLVRYGGKEVPVTFDDIPWAIRTAFLGDRRIDFGWERREESTIVLIDGIEYDVVVRDPKSELLAKVVSGAGGPQSAAQVRAPIPGLISKVLARPGELVKKDQTVLCLDAMKLENEIPSPRDGTLKSIDVQPGQPVEKGAVLFVVE
jgi:biotin carboxyl carrier protein